MSMTTRTVTPQAFRDGMSRFASNVNVVSVYDDTRTPRGMTVTAVCSVSLDPRLVLVCVNRSALTHGQILANGRFGINVLGGRAREIAEHCARPGSDKRLDESWLVPDPDVRSPVLATATVHLDCDVHTAFDAGTHTIFIGLVEHVRVHEADEPLLYHQGAYRFLEPVLEAS